MGTTVKKIVLFIVSDLALESVFVIRILDTFFAVLLNGYYYCISESVNKFLIGEILAKIVLITLII